MAYRSQDKQEEFATVEKGSRGEFIRVTRITPENSAKEASLDMHAIYGGKSRYGRGTSSDPEGG